MATVTVVMFPAAVNHFKSWEGPLGKAMKSLASSTKHFQQVFAPKRTGKLAASITVGPKVQWIGGLSVTVGTHRGGRGYAIYQELGTLPHIIRGKHGGVLHFGGTYTKVVHHPGNRPTHWAWNGLSAAMFQEGF